VQWNAGGFYQAILSSLQKLITWTKKSGKGKQEWLRLIEIPSVTLEKNSC
jgi:hypothetical protein